MHVSIYKKFTVALMAAFISFTASASSAERFEAHMQLLASDLLQGRDTGSMGHDFASLYIATELKKYGIKPGGDDGSYYQMINFKQSLIDVESPYMSVSNGQQTAEFTFMQDMLMSGDMNSEQSDLEGELVYVGFGIEAPFLNYSDLENIDLTGKIAVVLQDRPRDFPSEEGAHYWRESINALVNHGAIGVISVTTPAMEKLFSFNRRKLYVKVPNTRWVHPNGDVHNASSQLKGGATLNLEAGKQLFALAGMDLESIFSDIEKNKKLRSQAMGLRVKMAKKSIHSTTESPNVIGILEGSDPVLKNEYIILTAHSDHIGVSKNSVLKDRINNGAMDNASGVATLLEMAYEFQMSEQKPKRSIIFAFVTGEEKGLLGSDYYGNYPTVPIHNIVANVNLDMPILTYRTNGFIAFGAQHSSLEASVAKALRSNEIDLIDDPMPEEAIFVRSDQYSLVKQGIPAVYLVPGPAAVKSDMIGVSMEDFLSKHYHQPSDDLSLPIDYEWAAQFVDINFAIAQSLANVDERPTWNEDSFFKSFAKPQ